MNISDDDAWASLTFAKTNSSLAVANGQKPYKGIRPRRRYLDSVKSDLNGKGLVWNGGTRN